MEVTNSNFTALNHPPRQASTGVSQAPSQGEVQQAEEVRDAFTAFVGQTFFSQMIKAMRTSTDKPSYLHGGRGEEIFQGQLDQTPSETMTQASSDDFAGPMFRNQFPHFADILQRHQQTQNGQSSLADLAQLKQR